MTSSRGRGMVLTSESGNSGTSLFEAIGGTSLPFSFYYAPYLVTTIKHYDPITY
ncbi:hypothetical protein [Amycolatopsis vastitatis]|uniref:hypothetical protein n=1 Tax=Amycolatopsis vastitatis TaxID=1905142 RepID=UPI00196A9F44|nr:hypothetical protein [Amycolatopsis vastitatis]